VWAHVGGWLVLGLVILHLVAPSAGKVTSAGSAAPAVPSTGPRGEWGAKLALDSVDAFDVDGALMDLTADAEGNVYALTGSELRLYVHGRLSKALALPFGPNRSMAFDGKTLFVTDSDNNSVLLVDPALDNPTTIAVDGAKRLLGAAWMPKSGLVALAEVDATDVYFIEPTGRWKARCKGPVAAKAAPGFAYDLAADGEGRLYLNDIYGGQASVLSPERRLVQALPTPCGARLNNRLAVLGGRIYTHCQGEDGITVRSLKGEPLGYVPIPAPQVQGAGLDGFLYVQSDGKVRKFKPLEGSGPRS
jgi:sugar lactone lactonase YvrE